jgi:hypothetical protein
MAGRCPVGSKLQSSQEEYARGASSGFPRIARGWGALAQADRAVGRGCCFRATRTRSEQRKRVVPMRPRTGTKADR